MTVARARKKRNRVPHCCGKKMLYKDSYGIYVCDVCGKEKRVKQEQVDSSDSEVVKMLESIRDYLCAGNPIWNVDTVREVMDKAIKAVKEQENEVERL